MGAARKPRGSAFAYIAGLLVSAALIGGGGGAALWFRAHLGAPPPIVVVAQQPAAPGTSAVPTTRVGTTTPAPVVPQEAIPPQLPDSAAYTAAPASALPGFANRTANQYGWFGGDGVSARCDEWNRATVVGSTAQTLFVVCGSYFKAYELATGTPLRLVVDAGGGAWSGSGSGVSMQLTQSVLTLMHQGANPAVQEVVQWWTP
ncbi:hypothetical protein ACIP5Y_01525 [Nocardia sp. NPDC088792]|uniref:hypothetical protein n=1 Tax=Nocardia sp. NPDC088792 TaxID=3364332 RepID=UPI003802045A